MVDSLFKVFQKTVWDFYKKNGRNLPWRQTSDPYKILISEIMLQQTQVSRVLIKYQQFIKTFPDFSSLAKAKQSEVLRIWQGLGYNRRALYLQAIGKKIVKDVGKKFDNITVEYLSSLRGIGKNTACAIVVFTFNIPQVFIETNIRRVFIHHFFKDKKNVHDREIIPFITLTLHQKNPREWYFALMDYGAMLGKRVANPNRRSKRYKKQSRFEGSLRQVRGAILKLLLKKNHMSKKDLQKELNTESGRFEKAFRELTYEKFIHEDKTGVHILNN